MQLTAGQLEQLKATNQLLVEDFWDSETCDRVVDILSRRCSIERPWYLFPYELEDDLLWRLLVRSDVLQAAEAYLETPEIMLAGSHFQWRAASDPLDVDQRMHLDQGNNTLLVEPHDGPFRYFVMLSYWSDVGPEDGPTFISRESGEAPLLVKRGSAFFYNLNLVHRGSRMKNPAASRFASWFIFRPAATQWAGQSWFADKGEAPGMVQFLESASPRARNLLGIPLPGHLYWTEDTISRVQERYAGWDMGPYRAGLK